MLRSTCSPSLTSSSTISCAPDLKKPHWFLVVLFALVLPTLGKPPVADEESYLFMAEAISGHPLRPYDWWRVWQPWGQAPAESTYSFAHPPLHLWWLSLTQGVFSTGPVGRLVSAAPFLALYAWAAVRLCSRLTRHPNLALGFLLASPVLVLGLQDSWMIDLGFVALSTASVAFYRESLVERGGLKSASLLRAGLLLGLAASYKYPALVLLLVFAAHLHRLGLLARSRTLWLGVLGPFLGLQAFLLIQYGELHLVAAIQSAGEIDRSPMLERTAGLLVRLGFALSPLVLFSSRTLLRALPAGFLLGGGAAYTLGRGDLGGLQLAGLLALAVAGSTFVLRAATLSLHSPRRQRKGDRDDNFLLSAWVLLVLLSIVLGHNHADSRYLLPALLPMSLILVRSAVAVKGGRRILQVGLFAWGAVAFLTSTADYRLARATDALAQQMIEAHPPGRFSAEWTARWRLEKAGWVFWHHSNPLPEGETVLLFSNAGSSRPPEHGRVIETVHSPSRFPMRVLDWGSDAGYHSEQLGRLPLTWGTTPLASALLYEVSP